MSKTVFDRLKESMSEVAAISAGEMPAARIRMNGHNYVPEQQWQPIESAPKDGTSILVCVTYSVPDGWETIQWVDWQLDGLEWPVYRDRVDIPFRPTMWQHLPSTPITEGEK